MTTAAHRRSLFPWLLTLALLGCSSGESVVGGDAGALDAPPVDVPGADVPSIDVPDVSDVPVVDVTDAPAVDAPDAPDAPTGCTSSADCAGDPGGPACDASTGRCVACTAADDRCPAGQYCVAATNACAAGCRDDAACNASTADGGAGSRRCDTATHACVDCLTDDHCPAGMLCVGNTCVTGCNATRPCPGTQSCCGGACVDAQTNTAHCGACGSACTITNGTAACVAGACSVGACTAPYADCDMTAANGCEADTSASLDHCGGCGMSCAPANATASCASGACSIAACATGFADCDTTAANGCEVNTQTDLANCGGCGTACAPANATASCAAGACSIAACATGFADCDTTAANGCEVNTQTSAAHCGGCGMACAPANAAGACTAGACGVGTCNAGFADCDTTASNGCEVNTTSDAMNCGACGTVCAPRANASVRCEASACAFTCDAGYADCDGDATNGCEVNLNADPTHCGSCTNACAVANGTAACAAGACAVGACNAGFANCDGMVSNGCEANLASPSTCGSCTNACPTRANAGSTCLGGVCGFACNADFGNCDGNAANGCEVNIANGNASHCGGCGVECGLLHAVPACMARTCQVEMCDAGWGNCDGMPANGCEVNTRTSNAHCGACNNACASGTYCQSSACRLPVSCNALRTLNPSATSGEYDIDPDGTGPLGTQRVYCDMTSQGGGWTLIGSVVNTPTRAWNALGVFTDRATFGTIAARNTANYKAFAWTDVAANDLRVETAEYSFGWTALLGNRSMGAYVSANWPSTCNSTWARSGVDFYTGISAAQAAAFGFSLRALDSNASCFPGSNENAAINFYAAECCWVNGLGNTPGGQAQWLTHDLSLLRLSRITPVTCTAGTYPCNANGRTISAAGECYENDPSCKASYALVWVR
ncbi:MAG: fibrinogen-like YCDxxxxGGGW domain-containing protein [Polyangiales bacterium]